MIIWINGAFGAGKSTLTEHLKPMIRDSIVVDPEYLGCALAALVPASPTGDFQDLPIWRSLTLYALTEVRRLYQRPVIVPMTLVNPAYLSEILGGLQHNGQHVLHVYLDLPEATLRARVTEQIMDEQNPAEDQRIRRWRLDQVTRCLAARDHLPAGTHVLDSGSTDPTTLAEQVLALATVALDASRAGRGRPQDDRDVSNSMIDPTSATDSVRQTRPPHRQHVNGARRSRAFDRVSTIVN